MITPSFASQFASKWTAAWNEHDLDAVLAHYREDVRFSSPFARTLAGEPDGVIRGRAALRRYFRRGLETFPDLHFEPMAALAGLRSVALHYRAVEDREAIEVVELDADGRVVSSAAHYSEEAVMPRGR